ncbi:MAG: response regulator transcription factor [Acidimicrobiales bacterium]
MSPSSGHVLVIDDERAILRALTIALRARGYEVDAASSGEEGLSLAALRSPEVVVLDLGLPDVDGMDVCRRLRQWSDVPIVVLSAHGAEDMKVAALDAGADDYVTKPFGMAELEARLRVALRHRRAILELADEAVAGEPVITVGEIELDLARRLVRSAGTPVVLTAREFDLLACMVRHSGKVLTHRFLLQQVWGSAYGDEAHYLRVYVNRLRRKLGDAGGMLRTNVGVGYELVAEQPAGGSQPDAVPRSSDD